MKLTTINLVFLGLLLYTFSCFLGSTPITVCFILASVFFFIDLIKRLIKKQKINFDISGNLLFFSIALVLLVFSSLFLNLIHGLDFDFLGSISSVYKGLFLYFLTIYVFQNFDYQNKFKPIDLKRVFVLVIVIASTLSSLYILLQFLGLFGMNSKGHFGIISQTFTSSGLLLAGIFSTMYFIKESKKLVVFGSLLLQIFAIILLSQVSVWFGFLFGFFVINLRNRLVSFKLLSLILVLIASSLFIATEYVPRMKRKVSWFSSIEKLTTNKSIQCRKELWQLNLKDFDEVWLFGRKKLIDYSCTIKGKTSVLPHAHNIYLQQLFMGGVFKLLIWFSVYLSIFVFLIRTYKENQVFLGYFIALSTEGFFEYWWGDSEVKNIFLAIMFCALLTAKQQRQK